jgi:hypothetical protein
VLPQLQYNQHFSRKKNGISMGKDLAKALKIFEKIDETKSQRVD